MVQQPVDAFKRAKLLLNNNCPAADADAPTASAEESLNVPVCFQRMKTVVSLEDSIVVSTSRLKSNDYSTTTPASYRPSIKQYSSPDSSATSSSKRRLEILNQQLKLSKAARYTVVKRNRRATGSVGAAAGQEDDVQVSHLTHSLLISTSTYSLSALN